MRQGNHAQDFVASQINLMVSMETAVDIEILSDGYHPPPLLNRYLSLLSCTCNISSHNLLRVQQVGLFESTRLELYVCQ